MGHKPGHPGLWRKKHNASDPDVKVADFSYKNDEIAQKIIVRAWTDANFRDGLVGDATPNLSIATRIANARAALATLSAPNRINLTSPIVLREDEYYDGWEMDDDDQIVFVLPKMGRQQGDLLENAKFLMACVPNGI